MAGAVARPSTGVGPAVPAWGAVRALHRDPVAATTPGVGLRIRADLLAPTGTLAGTLTLVDAVPPVAGRVGHPRKRPEALLGDKGYDSEPNRRELRKRGILPVIS